MSPRDLQTVSRRVAEGVGWLTLDRPESLNAWTRQLGDDMLDTIDGFARDATVRAIVITGAGRAFSSGADLRSSDLTRPDGSFDVLTPLRESFNPLIARVRTVEKPVLAAVNGAAAGVGCSLALACDLVLAARSAYFLLAFVNVGLGLDGGASHSLVLRAGVARAFEMAYLGERVSAERALAWGLCNEVVADDELEARAGALAARLAAGPPRSFAAMKRTINTRAYDGFEELLDREAVLQQELAESADFQEGARAFAERRAARFSGD